MDSVRRAVTVGTAFSLGSIVATRAIGFLTSLLLARTLGPHSLGVYSILIGFHSVTVLIAGCGLTQIAPKLVAETMAPGQPPPPEARAVIRSLTAVIGLFGLVAGAATLVASPVLAPLLLGDRALWPTLAVTGAAVVAVVWSSGGSALLQGLHGIRRLAVLNILVAVLNLIFIVPGARIFGVAGAVGALGISHVCLTVALFISLPADLRLPRWKENAPILRRGLLLGLPLLLGSLVVPLVGLLARTGLGRLAGLADVGRYQVGETLNQAVLFFPMAVSVPLYPLVSSMVRASAEERARIVGPMLEYVALLTLPAAIVVGWGARLWVGLYGPEFEEAWPVVYILTGGYFLSSLGFVAGGILSGLGLTLDGLYLNLTWSVLYLLTAFLFMNRLGATGLALAYSLSYALYTGVLAYYLNRRLKLKLLRTWRVLGAWVVIFGLGWWLLPRLSPLQGALAAIPALILAAASGLGQWRRALRALQELVRSRRK